MKKYHLMAPGPTPIPPSVLQVMAQPILHHRTREFEAIFAEVRKDLRALFQTNSDVILFAASGTGGMEAAVVNLCSPGERVLAIGAGKFGERWGEICRAFGLDVVALKAPYGHAVTPEALEETLRAHSGVRSIFATHSETSTGVLMDIKGFAEVAHRHEALLVVDAVSSLGAAELLMDTWGLDVVVTGSQKGLMLPPGLALVGVGPRGWERAKEARLPKYYWNLLDERKIQAKNQVLYTPAVSLVVGLREALRLLLAEGLTNVIRRHDRLARATRAGAEALGLELFAKATPSPAVTAICAPPGIDGEAIVAAYSQAHNITIAGGQGEMKGKIFRLAHLGYVGDFDILTGLAALEMILKGFDVPVDLGAALGAAEKVFADER